ncbi:TPA: hypothetical protein SLN38_004738 [Serratia marcescens]|nr:hypothetical protein [Serratia marcescens]
MKRTAWLCVLAAGLCFWALVAIFILSIGG